MQNGPRTISLPVSAREAGLPRGTRVRTVHNAAGGITAVEIRTEGSPPLHRLYWRPARQSMYRSVVEDSEDLSFEDLITGEAPWLFARVVEWKRRAGGFSGTTRSLARLDIKDGEPVLRLIELQQILPENCRLSSLMRANDSGNIVQAIMIFENSIEPGIKRAEYKICAVDLSTKNVSELDTLPGLHF